MLKVAPKLSFERRIRYFPGKRTFGDEIESDEVKLEAITSILLL